MSNDSRHDTTTSIDHEGSRTSLVADDIKATAEEAGIGIVEAKPEVYVDEAEPEGEELIEDEKKDDGNKLEDRKKYADWPFRDIKEPHANDVLYGRGGECFVVFERD